MYMSKFRISNDSFPLYSTLFMYSLTYRKREILLRHRNLLALPFQIPVSENC